MHKFSEEQLTFIKKIAPGRYAAEITEMVNKQFDLELKVSQIESCKRNHNIKSGIDSKFKKGNIPANARAIGSERIDKNGYVLIKIQDGHGNKNWIRKHRYLYEQAYGEIPKGHKVIFADGNIGNFELNNLILISDAEELIMNKRKLFSESPEHTKTGVLIAKVLNKAKKR